MKSVLLVLLSVCLCAGEAKGTVVMDLTGSLDLRPAESWLGEGDPALHVVTQRLRDALAAPEPRLVLDLTKGFAPGPAAAEELAAVLRERPAGKRVACLVDGVEDAAMIVAAACDEVLMADAGILAVDGSALSNYYLAPALAKLGVRFHAVASGPWKTAHEPLTAAGPSEAAQAEMRELVQAIDGAVAALSLRPGLDAEALAKARALSPQPPALARSSGLVQSVVEHGQWLRAQPRPIRQIDGRPEVPDLSSLAGMMRFWKTILGGDDGPHAAKAVAVVELAGSIQQGAHSMPGESICPDDTVAMLARLADDRRVVAVVLRIDSPGGDAGASDRIHHAVRRLDQAKPVIALFDGVAASGGYYIGCAAREVFTHRTTITGSIGVFAVVPDLGGTLDLLGVHRHTVTVGERADALSPFGWNDAKAAAFLPIIQDVDRRFQGLVAARRRLAPERVAELAGGKVYTGEQAVRNGLCDGFGTLATAVARARELAKEGAPLPLERYPRGSGLAARLGLASTLTTAVAQSLVPRELAIWLTLRRPAVLAWRGAFSVR
jgi:protease-4